MARMELTAGLLSAENELVNPALFGGLTWEDLDAMIDMEFDDFATTFAEETGIDPQDFASDNGLRFFGDFAEYDGRGMYFQLASETPDFLESLDPELFGPDGAVKFGGFEPSGDAPLFRWSVDGEKLLAIYRDRTGKSWIDDGHGISGFIRTASDNYWAQVEVLESLVAPVRGWYKVWEWYSPVVPEYVNWGLAGERLYAA